MSVLAEYHHHPVGNGSAANMAVLQGKVLTL